MMLRRQFTITRSIFSSSTRNLSSIGGQDDTTAKEATLLGGMKRSTFFAITEKFCPFISQVFSPIILAAEIGSLQLKLPKKKVQYN
jgi:hypothetical protein